jgi:hypothetical protein
MAVCAPIVQLSTFPLTDAVWDVACLTAASRYKYTSCQSTRPVAVGMIMCTGRHFGVYVPGRHISECLLQVDIFRSVCTRYSHFGVPTNSNGARYEFVRYSVSAGSLLVLCNKLQLLLLVDGQHPNSNELQVLCYCGMLTVLHANQQSCCL